MSTALRALHTRTRPMRRRGIHPAARTLRSGSTQLEFALMLPFLMLFLAFMLNMGVLIVEHGALQHATNAAARAGAQIGGAGINDTSERVFNETTDSMPGLDDGELSFRVVSGSTCRTSGSNREVVIEASYNSPLAIPGMYQLMNLAGGDGSGAAGTWQIGARAVARCEVARR